MSWNKYIANASEASTPRIFHASDDAVQVHNQEVDGLQSRIKELEDNLKEAIEALKYLMEGVDNLPPLTAIDNSLGGISTDLFAVKPYNIFLIKYTYRFIL